MSRRTTVFVAIGLIVALVLAGVGSFYASSHPDGLERVATDQGFVDSADDSATADSPLADYGTKGVDNERAAVGVAGVIGVGVTFVLAGGAFWLLRRTSGRRGRDSGESAPSEEATTNT
jgi:cobalt/nickel transport protein